MMTLTRMLGLLICLLLTSYVAWAEDSSTVKWTAHCDLEDGRRLLTDGSLLLDSHYIPNVSVPEKSVPPLAANRLLQSNSDHEFGLADLEQKGSDNHYTAPGSIKLNRKYVDFLRSSPLKSSLRFRGKAPNDPVLILDGQKVVGVMMPMKS